jgi:hypothetical protein
MPIPEPGPGEHEDAFMSRCMAKIAGEYPDKSQAAAICHSQIGKSAMKQLARHIYKAEEYHERQTHKKA